MKRLLLGVVLVLAACDDGRTLRIESDGEWAGWVADKTDGSVWMQGMGNVSLPINGRTCWSLDPYEPYTLAVYIQSPSITGTDRRRVKTADCTQ